MPSSTLSVEMSGEEAKLFQSFQSVIRQAGKFEQSLDKSGQAATRLSREEQAMAREAKRAFEEARSPLEKYNAAKQTLDGLLKKNKISQEEYNAAVRKAKTEMDQAGQSGEKAFGAKQVESLKSYVMGVASVTAAIALVKGGLQEVLALGEEAAARARGSITSVGQLRQVATSQEDFEGLVGRARQIQGMGVEEGRAAQIAFAGRSAGMSEADTLLLGEMEGAGFVGDTASMARNTKALQQAMGVEETGGFRDIVGKALAASGGAPAAAEQILQASAVAAGGLGNLKVSDEELLAAVAQVSNVSGADVAGTQVRSLFFALAESKADNELLREQLPAKSKARDDAVADAWGEYNTTTDDVRRKAGRDNWKEGRLDDALRAAATRRDEIIAKVDAKLAEDRLAAESGIELTGGLMNMVSQVDAADLNDAQLFKLLGRKEAVAAHRLLVANRGDVAGLKSKVDVAAAENLLGTRMQFGEASLDAALAGKAVEEREKISRTQAGMGIEAELLGSMLNARDLDRRARGDTGNFEELNAITGRWMARSRAFVGRDRELENMGEQALQPWARPGREELTLLNANRAQFGIDTPRENAALDKLLKAAEAQERAAENLHRATAKLQRNAGGGEMLRNQD